MTDRRVVKFDMKHMVDAQSFAFAVIDCYHIKKKYFNSISRYNNASFVFWVIDRLLSKNVLQCYVNFFIKSSRKSTTFFYQMVLTEHRLIVLVDVIHCTYIINYITVFYYYISHKSVTFIHYIRADIYY